MQLELDSVLATHCVSDGSSIRDALEKIEQGEDRICFVIDDKGLLIRAVSDGDIRRALLKGQALDSPVHNIHNRTPIFANDGDSTEDTRKLFNKRINVVPVTNDSGCIVGLIRQYEALPVFDIKSRDIGVIGLGHVGLTLGLVLAEKGFNVSGFDVNDEIIDTLIAKKPPFFENGLDQYIQTYVGRNFRPIKKADTFRADVYVISVGTPFNKETDCLDDRHVTEAARYVGERLKKNDLVVMRSTLPIGYTRNSVIPCLERTSGLVKGIDFFVSVCPERTTEGNALRELKSLPQIIGGFDPTSCEISMQLFNENTQTVIDIGSLEAAEMCKLMDNTYRDIRFAFSNQLAILSEKLGLNLRNIVDKVNLSYERNDIPYPSPGVGGACLSKDPYVLKSSFDSHGLDGQFILEARKINEAMPGRIVERASESLTMMGKSIVNCKIFIMGFAFKGDPETSDLRSSTTLWFLGELREKGVTNIFGYDPIIQKVEIEELGIKYCSISEGFTGADAVFLMNNHRSFSKLNITHLLGQMNKPALFFDAWEITPSSKLRSQPGITSYGVGTY